MKLIIGVTIGVIVLIAGVIGLVVAFGPGASGGEGAGTTVRLAPVQVGELIETVSAPGQVEPATDVAISARVSARITEIPKMVRNFMGEEVVASNVVWVASTGIIPATAQVSWTMSDGSTQFPTLISIERPADQDGTHHHKLYFGSAGV